MEKYKVNFMDENGRRYYIGCDTMEKVKDIIAEEKMENSVYIGVEGTKKRSVVGAIGFFTVGVIGLLVGNIGFFALCSVMAWVTLTADIRGKISRIFRLEV